MYVILNQKLPINQSQSDASHIKKECFSFLRLMFKQYFRNLIFSCINKEKKKKFRKFSSAHNLQLSLQHP